MMSKDQNRLKFLFEKYLHNDISEEELNEFWQLINQMPDDDPVTEDIRDVWQKQNFIRFNEDEVAWNRIFAKVMEQAEHSDESIKKAAPVGKIVRWWWAAASVVVVLLASIWVYQNRENDIQPVVEVPRGEIEAPQSNRATVTLADGSHVYLDSINNGAIAQQGNIKLIKLENGRIAYQTESGEVIKEIKYNTLTNPRGSKVIDMRLSDGTHVWLNAGSSITYPVAFVENDRQVELKGEGYFEVKHDPAHPFVVAARKMKIQVLGTHFNVNAYDDEQEIRTTLLEGSVKVNANGAEATLRPGQQAILATATDHLKTTADVDLEQVMAWKNGYFSFQDDNLKEIMQQISRWYDVDVAYEGDIQLRVFGGGMARSAGLQDVLKILEESNIHFKQEGRKIIVQP